MANREEHLKKISAELAQLSDEELEKIAGGIGTDFPHRNPIFPGPGPVIPDPVIPDPIKKNPREKVVGPQEPVFPFSRPTDPTKPAHPQPPIIEDIKF